MMEYWLSAAAVCGAVGIGLIMALLALPGAWLMLAVAALCQWWQGGEMYSWWTLGAAAAIALSGEVAEFIAAAVGARTAGGSKTSAVAAIGGGLVGGLLGAPFVPPVGIILGGAVGAGVAAVAAERGIKRKPWEESSRAGVGAAAGRLAATVIKVIVASVVGAVLIAGAFWI